MAGLSYYGIHQISKSVYFLIPIICAFMLLTMTNGIRDGVGTHVKVSLVITIFVIAFTGVYGIPHFWERGEMTELYMLSTFVGSSVLAIGSYISFLKG